MASPDDQKWNSGFTALHYAVLSEHVEIVEFLVKAGCNASLPTTASVTATDYALTQVLGRRSETPKQKALKEIFKLSEVVQAWDFCTIHQVVLGLRTNITLEDAILDDPSMINWQDAAARTPLSWAVQRGDAEATRILLGFNADPEIPDVAGMTPLHYSTYSDDEACLELLVNHGVNTSPRDKDHGWVPIHYAAYLSNSYRMIDLLVRHGANVDDPTTSSKSSLVLAILKNHSNSVARLLESEPDMYLADNSGWVPLNCSIASRSAACLEHLVDAGIDLTQLGWGTETVLHLAAAYPELGTMQCLRRGNLMGVPIEAKNRDGLTASEILHKQDISEEVLQAFRDLLRKAVLDNQCFKDGTVELVVEIDSDDDTSFEAPVITMTA